ncbi:MAG: YceI family protein [Pseudomonadota bacterium]
MRKRMFAAAATLALVFGGTAAQAEQWVLSKEASKIAYGSIKRDSIGEVNHFTGLSGSVSPAGLVSVSIDLTTVETWIDIRNERMRKVVFEAMGADKATLMAEIDMTELDIMAPGDTKMLDVEGALAIGPLTIDIYTTFFVARLSHARTLVMNDEMIMLSTEEMGIDPSIDRLMELAELPGITRVAPVTLRLVFDRAA